MAFNARPMMLAILPLLILADTQMAVAERILFVQYQQPSQVVISTHIAKDLISRGHEVYLALAIGYPHSNEIETNGIKIVEYERAPGTPYPFTDEYEEIMITGHLERQTGSAVGLALAADGFFADCRAMASSERFMERARKLRFDFAVVAPLVLNPCYLLIPHLLGIRYASTSSVLYPPALRLPVLPSFHSMIVAGQGVVIPRLDTFVERLRNVLSELKFHLNEHAAFWGNTSLLSAYAPEVESWTSLLLSSELTIIQRDHHVDSALPLLPHVVAAAGITARPAQPLSAPAERIFEESSTGGVILASFGTVARRVPMKIAEKFLEAFERLNETVLTRISATKSVQIPKNVRQMGWLPQNDILGHPKTRLFITHCGLNGVYEALYHGVPMLGFPMFAEQSWNCAQAQRTGFALCLDLFDFTADQLYQSIRELIDNTTYRTTVRRKSEIWRSEPLFGREKAGYWIDHVIKYGGGHLRSPALGLHAYQLFLLDALVFVLLVVLLLSVALFLVVYVWMRYRGRRARHAIKHKDN